MVFQAKSEILKLTLTILRSLAFVSLCETTKLLVTTLTIKKYVASTLSWGSKIIIVIIIVRAIICISHMVCFGFAPLNGWGISPCCLSTKCAMCEYNPSTVAPVAINGIVGVDGSHFHIMCSRDFALSFTSAQSLHIIKCVCIIVGIVSINFSILASSF